MRERAVRIGDENDVSRALILGPAAQDHERRGLAIFYSEKPIDDKKGLELATKAREAFPTDVEVARALGFISYRTGNYSRAASLLQECTRTQTNEAKLWNFLGMAQHQLKNQAAAQSLRRALELNLKNDLAKEAAPSWSPKRPPRRAERI